jgi:hypothetical protein
MGLVTDLLEQVERLGITRQSQWFGLTREVDLFHALGQTHDGDVKSKIVQHLDRSSELADPTVDQNERWWVGESTLLLSPTEVS